VFPSFPDYRGRLCCAWSSSKAVQKLERYLDVTRAELFFARRVIFVEGAAELLMVNLLAKS